MSNMKIQIDGQDYTDRVDQVEFTTPRMVYEIPNGKKEASRLFGAGGFSIHLTGKERFSELSVHRVRIEATIFERFERGEHMESLTNDVEFKHWWEDNGEYHVFGILKDGSVAGEWVKENQDERNQVTINVTT